MGNFPILRPILVTRACLGGDFPCAADPIGRSAQCSLTGVHTVVPGRGGRRPPAPGLPVLTARRRRGAAALPPERLCRRADGDPGVLPAPPDHRALARAAQLGPVMEDAAERFRPQRRHAETLSAVCFTLFKRSDVDTSGRGGRGRVPHGKVVCMLLSTFRRGFGGLLVIVALATPGLAVAETARGPAAGEIGPILLWNLFAEIFLATETPPPPPDTQGGGAMDPNGGPKPTPPPPPPPPPTPS